jgi:hypothetical protein
MVPGGTPFHARLRLHFSPRMVDSSPRASLWLRQLTHGKTHMTESEKLRAVLTDTHFLIPLIVFAIGLALLITLH